MLDIVGIGYAMVDKTIAFDEENPLMREFLPYKGGFFSTSRETFNALADGEVTSISAGGSAANTIRDLALMGCAAGYIGKTGLDKEGELFRRSLKESKVVPFLIKSLRHRTGCCVVLVHEDGERTMCAKAGAAKRMELDEISPYILEESKAVFLEGYILNHNPELVLELQQMANYFGAQVYLTLSDKNCVLKNRDIILEIIKNVDVLFGNEAEFAALDAQDDEMPKVAVKTIGGRGCGVWADNKWSYFAPGECPKIVNTKGAGDAFAAGFLWGIMKEKSIGACVSYGNQCAVRVLGREESYI